LFIPGRWIEPSARRHRILDAVSELFDKARHVLAAGPPLRLAVVFGSFAKQRARPHSDLDVVILPHDEALSLRAELDLAARLSLETGREVDLVRLDRATTLLRWEIAKDGIPLIADPAWEWLRFRVAAASEHADMAEALDRAARLFRRRIAGTAP
jgi:predicted nucleotidyltransferase